MVRRMPVSIAISAKSGVCSSKNGAALVGVGDAVELAQLLAALQQRVDPALVGAGQVQVGLDAGGKRGTRRLWLQEIGVEAFERIEPVVVARDRIDRLGEALERQVEIVLVVGHRAGRIDHVRRDHQKLDVVAPAEVEIALDQRILRGVAFAGVADHDEAEVAAVDAGRRDPEQAVACAVDGGDRIDHAGAPDVDAQLRHLLVDAARPALRVEIPAEAPDRIDRDEQHGERQAEPDRQRAGGRERGARIAQRGRERIAGVGPQLQAAARQRGQERVLSREPQLPGLAIERARQLPPAQPQRQHQQCAEHERHGEVAGRGDDRGDQAEPGVIGLHAPEMRREQHDTDHEQPVPLDVSRYGRAFGAQPVRFAEHGMLAEPQRRIRVDTGDLRRAFIGPLHVRRQPACASLPPPCSRQRRRRSRR